MDQEAPSQNNADHRFRAVCDQIVEMMDRPRVPGVAVGILYGNEEYVAGFGVTSVEHPLPVTADTRFQIGSITKTITGTLAMQLVNEGLLDLDAPARAYLPELYLADETVAARVTMRHLLTHTGGWVGDYFDDTGNGDDALARKVERMVNLRQLSPLGQLFSYNNAGFYIAGRVIETLTGTTYETAVQERLLDPLGMSDSCFFAADVMTHRFAVGHHIEEDAPKVARPWPLTRGAHPAGGLTSTVKDQLRYARFHLEGGTTPDGRRLLAHESIARMQAPQAPAGNGIDAVGLTWMLRERSGRRLVGHGGATNGQRATLELVPEAGFAISVLTNADPGNQVAREAARLALREYLGIEDPDPAPIDGARDAWQTYVGRYSAALQDLVIRIEDGRLMLHVTPKGGFPEKDSPPLPPPPPAPIALYGDDRIVVVDGAMAGARGELLRAPDGSIEWLRFGLRVHARQPA